MQFGYEWAFVVNALSFVFSAWAIWQLRSPEGHFRPDRARAAHDSHSLRNFWADFADSLRYMRSTPLVLAIALAWVGWATGGGAAQILFTLYGELVFKRGPAGIGIIWSAAGFGLVAGGFFAHWLGKRLSFRRIPPYHFDRLLHSRRQLHTLRSDADHRAGVIVRRHLACSHGLHQRPESHHAADSCAGPLPRPYFLHRGDDDECDDDDLVDCGEYRHAVCSHSNHRSGRRLSERLSSLRLAWGRPHR